MESKSTKFEIKTSRTFSLKEAREIIKNNEIVIKVGKDPMYRRYDVYVVKNGIEVPFIISTEMTKEEMVTVFSLANPLDTNEPSVKAGYLKLKSMKSMPDISYVDGHSLTFSLDTSPEFVKFAEEFDKFWQNYWEPIIKREEQKKEYIMLKKGEVSKVSGPYTGPTKSKKGDSMYPAKVSVKLDPKPFSVNHPRNGDTQTTLVFIDYNDKGELVRNNNIQVNEGKNYGTLLHKVLKRGSILRKCKIAVSGHQISKAGIVYNFTLISAVVQSPKEENTKNYINEVEDEIKLLKGFDTMTKVEHSVNDVIEPDE